MDLEFSDHNLHNGYQDHQVGLAKIFYVKKIFGARSFPIRLTRLGCHSSTVCNYSAEGSVGAVVHDTPSLIQKHGVWCQK